MNAQADQSLWQRTVAAGTLEGRFLTDAGERLHLAALAQACPAEAMTARRSVLIWSQRQLPAIRAMLALDGAVPRIVLCPPDLAPEQLPVVIGQAQVDLIVSDDLELATPLSVPVLPIPTAGPKSRNYATEWLMFTSGTSGAPKLVVHTLNSLTSPLQESPASPGLVWATFYDVRRYGGLQILLRALVGGGSLILSQRDEPPRMFLHRAGQAGATHVTGTPSHWRWVLMSGNAAGIAPRYVRLSGEVADQSILDKLATTYPHSRIVHAFASTEAGVGFEVPDGLAGFPARIVNAGLDSKIRVVDGSLRLRSACTALRYLDDQHILLDRDGFVDTGDLVELRDDRYFFVGRRDGVINVGGLKVQPEEIESVISGHSAVQATRVLAQANPITGNVLVAEILLQPAAPPFATVRDEIMVLCRNALPAHKRPAIVRAVNTIALSSAGKVARPRA